MSSISPDIFSTLHIDIARNSTDDFNLFHDCKRWPQIRNTPFNGPITLSFQLESLIEGKIAEYRRQGDEEKLIAQHDLHFSNYHFLFANAVKPGQAVEVEIKNTQLKSNSFPRLSNRIIVKADGNLAMYGRKEETPSPLYLADADFSHTAELKIQPDRCFLNNGFFLKRKFIMTSNAKNFLCASLRDQSLYFDELQDKVKFPEIFPCAFLSSALLEKALKWGHDLERDPMVYTSHKISVDRRLLGRLKSNDALHILIKPAGDSAQRDFGDLKAKPLDYECYGLVDRQNDMLFRALISLAPLETIKPS